MILWCFYLFINLVNGFPAVWVQKILKDSPQNDIESSLEPYAADFSDLDIYFKGNLTKKALSSSNYTKKIIPFSTEFNDKNLTVDQTRVEPTTATSSTSSTTELIKPLNKTLISILINDTRVQRQDIPRPAASQEEDSDEDDGNMLTGLLSSFLSGLSRPDGGVDVEAIVGLLGSLSIQNPDGSYDFSGLTELLRSFFGGDEDGGGSDIGAFVGGLVGAIIRGVANPPGAKGAGIFSGKILGGILPALSAPAPSVDADGNEIKPMSSEPDTGSFLTGLLKTILGGGNAIVNLIKLIISTMTGVATAASSLSSKSDWK